MLLIDHGSGVLTFTFDSLGQDERILHFVSTRRGGTSDGRYTSLNLGFHTGDSKRYVQENRQRLAGAMGVPVRWLTVARQVHGNHVRLVEPADRGAGALEDESTLDASDAMITRAPNLCLMVIVGDCVPVLLYDPGLAAIGVIHAGWRGTVAQVTAAAVQAMIRGFGSDPEDIRAGIGPSIGPHEYEVGPEVVEEAQRNLPDWEAVVTRGESGYRFDLWEANRLQLLREGVNDRNIEIAGLSSYALTDSFFSERRDGRPTGRFAVGIMLRRHPDAYDAYADG
ncbi:MAG: peptidoglycan editing factor PgeF [Actinomycetota bacterium]